MKTKDRRNSGWTFPSCTLKGKKRDIINDCLEPRRYYNEWINYRDGTRSWMNDRTKLKTKDMEREWSELKKWNCKLKRLLVRRKERRYK